MRRPMMIPTTIARARASATTTTTTTTTRGKKKDDETRARDGANEEAGFWGRISWLHLFFLGLFVLADGVFALDYFFVHAAAGTRVRVAHARGEDDQRED